MKQIFIILILSSVFLTGKGQKTTIALGFQSGLNISTAFGNGILKEFRSTLKGFHIGGHMKISKSENWGLKLLLSYDRHGWVYKSLSIENSGAGIVNADMLYKLDYLNLPILAEYSFGQKVRININGGLFLGILLHNMMVTELKQPVQPNQYVSMQSSPDDRNRLNFGLSLGTGIQIPISSKLTLDFNLGDNVGLSNIYKSPFADKSKMKTNNIALSAGLTFKVQ